jgi:cytochrome c-type biogenesis protein CcmH/NrfG
MMLDRDKISFWTRVGAIALAVIFVGSFVFMGIGTNISYNLFDLLGGGSKDQEGQTTSSSEQLARAQEDLQKDPQNPRIIKRLAGLYIQNGQTDSAVEVLEQGQEVAPEDPTIPLYLGQAYDRKAQAQTDEDERKATYQKAGDAYAAATEIKDEPQAYLLAGQAYDQAGDKAKAIQYWNGYLKLQPEGTQSDAVKERISSLLKGEETTSGAGGAKK